jgi:hypothetical protein
MNTLVGLMLLCNLTVIPFTIFVAPFFIDQTNGMADDISNYVTDAGKQKLNELKAQSPLEFYILPIVFTNIVVLSIYGIVNYRINKETKEMLEWAKQDRENHKKDIEERYRLLGLLGQNERRTPI